MRNLVLMGCLFFSSMSFASVDSISFDLSNLAVSCYDTRCPKDVGRFIKIIEAHSNKIVERARMGEFDYDFTMGKISMSAHWVYEYDKWFETNKDVINYKLRQMFGPQFHLTLSADRSGNYRLYRGHCDWKPGNRF